MLVVVRGKSDAGKRNRGLREWIDRQRQEWPTVSLKTINGFAFEI